MAAAPRRRLGSEFPAAVPWRSFCLDLHFLSKRIISSSLLLDPSAVEFLSIGSAQLSGSGLSPSTPSSSLCQDRVTPSSQIPPWLHPNPLGPVLEGNVCSCPTGCSCPVGPDPSAAGESSGLGRGTPSPFQPSPAPRGATVGCGDASTVPTPGQPEPRGWQPCHTHTHKVTPACFEFLSQTPDPCACSGMSWNVLYTRLQKSWEAERGRAGPQGRAWPIPWNRAGLIPQIEPGQALGSQLDHFSGSKLGQALGWIRAGPFPWIQAWPSLGMDQSWTTSLDPSLDKPWDQSWADSLDQGIRSWDQK